MPVIRHKNNGDRKHRVKIQHEVIAVITNVSYPGGSNVHRCTNEAKQQKIYHLLPSQVSQKNQS